jgi:ribosomal protein L37AE/L43A
MRQQRQKKTCDKCNRTISLSNFKKHVCKINLDNLPKSDKLFNKTGDKYKCPKCGKLCHKKGINFHFWRMHTEEGKKFVSKSGFNKAPWNKGLTKQTDIRIKKL